MLRLISILALILLASPDPARAQTADPSYMHVFSKDAVKFEILEIPPDGLVAYGPDSRPSLRIGGDIRVVRSGFGFGAETVVLEKSLGGLYPIMVKGFNRLEAHLAYAPWAGAAFIKLADGNTEVAEIPGYREKKLSFDLEDQIGEDTEIWLDLPKELGFASADEIQGLIRLTLTMPQAAEGFKHLFTEPVKINLAVSDLALHLSRGQTGGLVWLTGLEGAAPLAGAEVELLDAQGRSRWQGRTGPDGLAELPGLTGGHEFHYGEAADPDRPVWLTVRHGRDSLAWRLYGQELSGAFYNWLQLYKASAGFDMHTISRSPVYQAGHEVRLASLVQTYTDSWQGQKLRVPGWRPLSAYELEISIQNEDNKKVYEGKAVTDSRGWLALTFRLPEDAPVGVYTLFANHSGREGKYMAAVFRVANFHKPDFKVTLTPPPDQPVPLEGDKPLAIELTASPSPAKTEADAKVRYGYTGFRPEGLSDYRFGPSYLNPDFLWNLPPMAGFYRRTGRPNLISTTGHLCRACRPTKFCGPSWMPGAGLYSKCRCRQKVTIRPQE